MIKEENMEALIAAYEEYIDLLAKAESQLIGIAYAHGAGISPEMIKRGEECRAKIAHLKQKWRDELSANT